MHVKKTGHDNNKIKKQITKIKVQEKQNKNNEKLETKTAE